VKIIKCLADKVGFVLCTALLGTLTGHTTYAAEVSVEVSAVAIHTESDFYEPLSPYGRWEAVGSYGRCWIPGGVDAAWSPYSNGYWQRTDDGWYWVSDEPWSWATYHYGRWDSSPQFGWYWVPQTQWAPAWVSWREGGGYIGWAPLGPSGRRVVQVNQRGVAPRGYVFVEERRFLEPVGPKTVIVNNTAINKTVINKKGPDTAVIEKASGRKVQAVPVRDLRSKEEAKVVAKHPTPTSTSEKAVQTPVTKNEVHQADEQSRVTKLDGEKRAQQEKAREMESEKGKPVPAAVVAKPETKPEAKVESKPVVERPAATKEPTERKAENDGEKKD
jgi:hypothetical protein